MPASTPGWAGSCWLQWWSIVVRAPTGQVGLGARRWRRSGVGGSEGLLGESELRNGTQYRNGGSASSSCRPRSERGGWAGSVARRARVIDRGLGALAACGLTGGTSVRIAPTAPFRMVLVAGVAPSLLFLAFLSLLSLCPSRGGEKGRVTVGGTAFHEARPEEVGRRSVTARLEEKGKHMGHPVRARRDVPSRSPRKVALRGKQKTHVPRAVTSCSHGKTFLWLVSSQLARKCLRYMHDRYTKIMHPSV